MLQSSSSFEKKASTQKGRLGEDLVDSWLIEHGVIPYAAVVSGAHPFDRLCARADKKRLYVVDAKSKARRTYYPDTGINLSHYEDYMHIKTTYGIPIYLFFVDEHLAYIYGGELDHLSAPRKIDYRGKILIYPIRQGKIIYFPLRCMKFFCPLDEQSANNLKSISVRNYEYPLADDEFGIELP